MRPFVAKYVSDSGKESIVVVVGFTEHRAIYVVRTDKEKRLRADWTSNFRFIEWIRNR